MSDERCETCRFFWASASGAVTLCRREPPRVYPPRANEDEQLDLCPAVHLTWWCGEYQPRQEPDE